MMPDVIKSRGKSIGDWFSTLFSHPNAALLRRILHHTEVLMATLADVQTALASVSDTIAAERAEVQAKLTDLSNQIKALQDQIAAGGAVTPMDLDGVVAAIETIKGGIGQISEPTV